MSTNKSWIMEGLKSFLHVMGFTAIIILLSAIAMIACDALGINPVVGYIGFASVIILALSLTNAKLRHDAVPIPVKIKKENENDRIN